MAAAAVSEPFRNRRRDDVFSNRINSPPSTSHGLTPMNTDQQSGSKVQRPEHLLGILLPRGPALPSFALASCDPCSSVLIRGLFLASRERHAELHGQRHLAIEAAQFQAPDIHPHESVMPQAPTVGGAGVGSIFGDARGGQLATKIAGQFRPSRGDAVTVRRILCAAVRILVSVRGAKRISSPPP